MYQYETISLTSITLAADEDQQQCQNLEFTEQKSSAKLQTVS